MAPSALSWRASVDDLLLALDRARAGDHGHPRAADLQPARLDHGPLALQLRRGPLVRSHDRQDLLDPIARLEDFGQPRSLLPQRGDDRLVRSVDHLGLQPERGDVIRHVLDLRGRCVRFHDNDHGRPSSTWVTCFASTDWNTATAIAAWLIRIEPQQKSPGTLRQVPGLGVYASRSRVGS